MCKALTSSICPCWSSLLSFPRREAVGSISGALKEWHQASVLLGAHGAGLAWMVAMEPGSFVVELMPASLPGYIACVETWDHLRNARHSIYGGLAHVAGQQHICIKGNGTVSFEVENFREKSFEVPLAVVLRRIHEAMAKSVWGKVQGSARQCLRQCLKV